MNKLFISICILSFLLLTGLTFYSMGSSEPESVKKEVIEKEKEVEKNIAKEINEIPFETKKIKDPTLRLGIDTVAQEGAVGEIYKTIILKEPVDRIIKIGTQTSAMGGSNCNHWFEVVDRVTQNERERSALKALIRCETRCNDSKNNNNTYLGLLQFRRSTFYHYGGTDIWDGEQQIRAALKILNSGPGSLSHHWPACSENRH